MTHEDERERLRGITSDAAGGRAFVMSDEPQRVMKESPEILRWKLLNLRFLDKDGNVLFVRPVEMPVVALTYRKQEEEG